MLAFSAVVPVRLVLRENSVCGRSRPPPFSPTRCAPASSLSTPNSPASAPQPVRNKTRSRRGINAPQKSKRVPTYKKLQSGGRHTPQLSPRSNRNKQKALEPSEAQRHPGEKSEKGGSKENVQKQVKKPEVTLKLSDLAVGEKLKGVVRNTVDHGAYINVGTERDGLVHLRDMSVDFVHVPSDLVREGDAVQVWVKYVDPAKKILGLTMIKPHLGFDSRIKVSDVKVDGRYRGVVERVTNFGAYVDIGAERQAFLHISGLWGECQRDTLDYLRLGQRIWVNVVDVDLPKSHIRLWARARGGQKLSETAETSHIPTQPKIDQMQDYVAPAPTRRIWEPETFVEDVNETENEQDLEKDDGLSEPDSIEDDFSDDEYSFAKDMDTWFKKRESSGRKGITGLQEIALMLNQETEFIDDEQS